LAIQAGAQATVSDSTITHNKADGGARGAGGSDGKGVGGGVYVYNIDAFVVDALTVIKKNHASTSNDDIGPGSPAVATRHPWSFAMLFRLLKSWLAGKPGAGSGDGPGVTDPRSRTRGRQKSRKLDAVPSAPEGPRQSPETPGGVGEGASFRSRPFRKEG